MNANFWRGMAIVAAIAAVIVVFDQETSLLTAAILLQVAFYIALVVGAYFLWRDLGRREIATWPDRQQYVFYAAVGVLAVDLGWFFYARPSGPNLLVFFLVLAACVYAGVHTWREQQRLS
jgi:amino acid transporter